MQPAPGSTAVDVGGIPPGGLVVLGPGQGAQAVGMASGWLASSGAALAVFERAERVTRGRLPVSIREACLSGPADVLNRTDVSQPALFVSGIACWYALCERWSIAPDGSGLLRATLGLSLGEYTALCVAGCLTFEAGLELVMLRGRAMQDAAERSKGGMLALVGADEAQARGLCEAALAGHGSDVLVCANFNAPGQIVLSGSRSACDRALALAGERGLRAQPLAVAGAFHSPLMQPAADRLAQALAATPIAPPRCPVMCNVTALPHAPEAATIRARLAEQLTASVRWSECCVQLASSLAASGGAQPQWHELAPGKTLAGLMRRIDKGTTVTTHDTP